MKVGSNGLFLSCSCILSLHVDMDLKLRIPVSRISLCSYKHYTSNRKKPSRLSGFEFKDSNLGYFNYMGIYLLFFI